ncbi:hypothetical protein WUBG_14249 [Wuchereria bancrofti]|uniref:Uncharacterized protein n=1 Tax=Wuchereria bancrofti TaxID=6293 RepID=J9ECS5_WUCBA|nr:hypothetical protein WUBG_14249 [Wuchereria bancrofti]
MDVHEQSINTQSENDEIIDEMTNTSDSGNLAIQEVSQDHPISTAAPRPTFGSINSSSNYPAPYPNPINLTIQPPLNGMNIHPVYFTDSQSASFITDNRNASNYEEISTNPSLYPIPPTTISLYSDIQRSAAANHGGLYYLLLIQINLLHLKR